MEFDTCWLPLKKCIQCRTLLAPTSAANWARGRSLNSTISTLSSLPAARVQRSATQQQLLVLLNELEAVVHVRQVLVAQRVSHDVGESVPGCAKGNTFSYARVHCETLVHQHCDTIFWGVYTSTLMHVCVHRYVRSYTRTHTHIHICILYIHTEIHLAPL